MIDKIKEFDKLQTELQRQIDEASNPIIKELEEKLKHFEKRLGFPEYFSILGISVSLDDYLYIKFGDFETFDKGYIAFPLEYLDKMAQLFLTPEKIRKGFYPLG